MTFFADEGLDAPLVELLRKEEYTVIYAAEEMKGASDIEVLERAYEENAILITKDKDFGELVIRNKMHSRGVVLIRVDRLNILANCLWVLRFINKHKQHLKFSFTVIEEDKIRIRDL
jgi:predicted nuclease of predicted toxin-antitoxin system